MKKIKRIYQEGSKSRAVCYECEKVVLTTMEYRPIESSEDANFFMLNLLVGVCDICSNTVSTPQQSAEEIKVCRRVFKKIGRTLGRKVS